MAEYSRGHSRGLLDYGANAMQNRWACGISRANKFATRI